jgi:hypothetical protein
MLNLIKKEGIMTTPQHCPGFEAFRSLKSFFFTCNFCGKEVEIFSDEFDKKHFCKECKHELDFTKCSLRPSVA